MLISRILAHKIFDKNTCDQILLILDQFLINKKVSSFLYETDFC